MANIIYMYHKNGGSLQPKAETTRLNMIERGKSRYTPSIPRYISIYKRNLFLDFNLNRSSSKKMAHFKALIPLFSSCHHFTNASPFWGVVIKTLLSLL